MIPLNDTKTYPIVGYRFHFPAKAVLGVIPIGTPLRVTAEPNNPYDPNAIKITLDSAAIPLKSQSALIREYGVLPSQIPDVIHLGYIPKEFAAVLRSKGFWSADGEFSIGAQGGPQVKIKP